MNSGASATSATQDSLAGSNLANEKSSRAKESRAKPSNVEPSTGKPRKVPRRLLLDIVVDSSLMVAFTVDSNTSLTGIAIHEWLGLAFGLAFMVHLALHWDWVLKTMRRLFSNVPKKERLKWFVDLLLYFMMGAAVVSGWYISRHAAPAIGVARVQEKFFRGLHGVAANISVILVGIHLGLNWRWMRATWIRVVGRSKKATV
jgi:cytochrome b561